MCDSQSSKGGMGGIEKRGVRKLLVEILFLSLTSNDDDISLLSLTALMRFDDSPSSGSSFSFAFSSLLVNFDNSSSVCFSLQVK